MYSQRIFNQALGGYIYKSPGKKYENYGYVEQK